MGRTIEKPLENYYSTDYINQVFYVWYSMGRPGIPALMPFVPENNMGLTPTGATISAWRRNYGWVEQADRMDNEVREIVEQQYILPKAKMLSKHAEIGRKLWERGMEYLDKFEIKNANAAIRAIEVGVAMERDSTNLEKLMDEVSRMDDGKLVRRLDNMFSKVKMNVDTAEEEKSLPDGGGDDEE